MVIRIEQYYRPFCLKLTILLYHIPCYLKLSYVILQKFAVIVDKHCCSYKLMINLTANFLNLSVKFEK